jgi:NADPH:quinone reductase-like Zn-dependent oxidoreductase
MKAATVSEWGTTPQYLDVSAPPAPATDEVQIRVIAAGTHRLVRSRTTGTHFSATKLPHVPGSDGVGRTVPDGDLVYFTTFWEKGSFAEIVNVAKRDVTPLPSDADPVQIAGLVNPAISSWMAMKARTFNLPEKFTVLIMGATTTSGAVALDFARLLGASKVIGAARNLQTMQALGYDAVIELQSDPAATDFSVAEDVDVILDYIYGPATVQLFKALKPTTPVQYVEIGSVSGSTMELPGDVLRSKDVTIRGAAPGSYSMQKLADEMPKIFEAIRDIPQHDFKIVKLQDIEKEWADEKNRVVYTIGEENEGQIGRVL